MGLFVCFEVLLRPDDGGPVVCQLLQRGKNTQKFGRSVTQMHAKKKILRLALLSFTQVSFQRQQLEFVFTDKTGGGTYITRLKYWHCFVYQSAALFN